MAETTPIKFTSTEFRYLDLRLIDGKLQSELKTVSASNGVEMSLVFGADQGPAVLEGAIHAPGCAGLTTATKRYMPDFLGGVSGAKLYCWSDDGIDAQPIAVVLPEGHTTAETQPVIDAVGVSGGRVVLFWLKADRRTTWMLKRSEGGNAAAEVVRLREQLAAEAQRAQSEAAGGRMRRVVVSVGALAATLVLGFLGARHFMRNDPDAGELAMRGVRQAPAVIDESGGAIYAKSYALVVGIDDYGTDKWTDLSYARRDAEGFAKFLTSQGFDEVFTLYDKDATKNAIVNVMQSEIARRAQEQDRVVVFFAGHGHTESLGGKDWGYLVPSDGDETSASYISMEELQTQSEKMGLAKHQLFILDACYGGLFAMRSGGVDENMPNYIQEITRRTARQVMTAGGSDQQVLDGGPGGHSVFTGHFLQGVEEGLADNNGDGYVTFAELTSYILPRASNRFQTPAFSSLPGHGNGEFVFKVQSGL